MKLETIAVHGGYSPDPTTKAVAVPIYQTASYAFDDTFGVESGREGGARFQDALKLVTRLVNIGDAKSLACHPVSTPHRQLSPEELAKAGVTEDTVRLSIGIEHIDDIGDDLEQAWPRSELRAGQGGACASCSA